MSKAVYRSRGRLDGWRAPLARSSMSSSRRKKIERGVKTTHVRCEHTLFWENTKVIRMHPNLSPGARPWAALPTRGRTPQSTEIRASHEFSTIVYVTASNNLQQQADGNYVFMCLAPSFLPSTAVQVTRGSQNQNIAGKLCMYMLYMYVHATSPHSGLLAASPTPLELLQAQIVAIVASQRAVRAAQLALAYRAAAP